MKKNVLFFLFVISIFSFATEKSEEKIVDEIREKTAVKEEVIFRDKQEKLKKEKEAKKEALKLIEEKRRQIIEEPLVEKYSRAEDKVEAYEKALKIAEGRMSFVEMKDSEDPTVKAYKSNISKKHNDINKERQKILVEREKIEKRLKALDKLETKVKNW